MSEMLGYASQGFDLLKMKVGGLEIAEDAARVNSVLNALPQTSKLIVDGVYSYEEDEARQLFDTLPAEEQEDTTLNC